MVIICITTIDNIGDIYLPGLGTSITMVSVISVIYDQEYTLYAIKHMFNWDYVYDVYVSGIVCRE